MNSLSKVLLIAFSICWTIVCLAGTSAAVAPETKCIDTVAEGNNTFAVNLFHRIGDEKGNVFFSPYSLYNAMAMALEGANGQTASEMAAVMGLSDKMQRIEGNSQSKPVEFSRLHKGLSLLNEKLIAEPEGDNEALQRIHKLEKALRTAKEKVSELEKKGNRGEEYRKAAAEEHRIVAGYNQAMKKVNPYELNIANALWGEKTYPFSSAYINAIDNYYNTGGIYSADFKTNFPTERKKINNWVAEKTNQRIKDIVPELSPKEARLLRLIITNAIFFKGEWAEPFSSALTDPRPFYLPGEKKILVPMMFAEEYEKARYAAFNTDGSFFDTPQNISEEDKNYSYYPSERGFAMLEIPYKGEQIAMLLIRPNATDGLCAIEQKLDSEKLDDWISKLQYRTVHVYMPKFKLETSYKMKKYLEKLGMRQAFKDPLQPDGADFSGMCDSTDPLLQLYITKILHKAFVEVDEKGTEAAAATAIMMNVTSCAPFLRPFIPTFKADRPFIFIIRDRVSNTILFMGRMENPK